MNVILSQRELLNEINDYLPIDKYEVMFVSEVGSQMWNMGDLSSDHDMVIVFKDSTERILRGNSIEKTLPCKHHVILNGREYDFSYLEIGHLCNLLKKGNINAIWALLSPLVYCSGYLMNDLIEIFRSFHTSDIIPSGSGMILSQLRDSVKRAEVRSPEKSIKTAYRTARFVYNHLKYGDWSFSPVTNFDVSEETVMELLGVIQLLKDYEECKPIDKIAIEDWLYKVRVMDL